MSDQQTVVGHTPGPWRYEADFREVHAGPWTEYKILAEVSPENRPGDFIDDHETAANARLIAAAPELLDVVRDFAHGVPACAQPANRGVDARKPRRLSRAPVDSCGRRRYRQSREPRLMTTPPSHAELRGQPFSSALGRGGLPPMYASWEEYATATQSRAEAAERALGDLINDLSDSNQADIPIHRVAVRSDHDVLSNIASLLEELVVETKRSNSTAREGAVSSCEIKFLAPTKDHPEGKPQPVIKAYAGSPIPVDEAIEAYGRAFLILQQTAMEGWEQTVTVLARRDGNP